MVPKLTTIKQPGTKMAKRCVEILLRCIENQEVSVVEQIDFSLVIGESTQKVS